MRSTLTVNVLKIRVMGRISNEGKPGERGEYRDLVR
jgi:hypothetical protein